MPNIKSAKKRVKVNQTKNLRNRMVKSQVKTAFKKFDTALESKDVDSAKTAYSQAASAVDKAAGKGVVSKQMANRKKARMAMHLQKLNA